MKLKNRILVTIIAHCCFLFNFASGSIHHNVSQEQSKQDFLVTIPLLHQNFVVSRRRRELLQNNNRESEDIPPSGRLYQGYGTHYVDLWVGTPVPQRQTLIVYVLMFLYSNLCTTF